MFRKIIVLLALSTLCTTNIKAQSVDYHPFKLDIAVGFGFSTAPNTDIYGASLGSGAINVTLEPHYLLNNNFSIGLRMQEAITGNLDFDSNPGTYNYGSDCLTGDYYIVSDKVRVFLGARLGVFGENKSNNSDVSNTYFGGFARAGIEIKHFRASVEYNFTGGLYNYAGFNFGASFGDGKRKIVNN